MELFYKVVAVFRRICLVCCKAHAWHPVLRAATTSKDLVDLGELGVYIVK